jgi:hypothetical protein
MYRVIFDLLIGSKGRVKYTLGRPSLTGIMEHAQGREATDPKDKVFALYGILRPLIAQRLRLFLPLPACMASLGPPP